ncbi:hypothetical protein Gpo141_00012544 [Globisporangium polare]
MSAHEMLRFDVVVLEELLVSVRAFSFWDCLPERRPLERGLPGAQHDRADHTGRLAEIAWHPFIQQCMRGVSDNEVVLSIATLSERTSAAIPLNASYYGVYQFYK